MSIKTKNGVAIEYSGKYWGIVHDDGDVKVQPTEGWTDDMDKVLIYNPMYLKKPEDATYTTSYNGGYNPYVKELRKGRLVKVTRNITTEHVFEN